MFDCTGVLSSLENRKLSLIKETLRRSYGLLSLCRSFLNLDLRFLLL